VIYKRKNQFFDTPLPSCVKRCYRIYYFFYNKTVDFKLSVHDTFLEYPSLGILKIERLATYHQKIV